MEAPEAADGPGHDERQHHQNDAGGVFSDGPSEADACSIVWRGQHKPDESEHRTIAVMQAGAQRGRTRGAAGLWQAERPIGATPGPSASSRAPCVLLTWIN